MFVFAASAALCALQLSTLIIAAPASSNYVIHETSSPLSSRQQLLQARSKLDGQEILPMRVGLTQSNLDAGHDWLMDNAHPESTNYGKHWTPAQVNTAFAPNVQTIRAVREWLISAGIPGDEITIADNKGWLAFDATVEQAETLFRAQYYTHKHHETDKYTIGCDAYSLPESIREHVDYITPGVAHRTFRRSQHNAPKSLSKRSHIIRPDDDLVQPAAKTVPANCSTHVINADCIRSMYGLPPIDVNKKVNPNNALGIFETQEQKYSAADLKLFFQNFEPQVPLDTIPEETSVDGGTSSTTQANSGGEAMLDITIAYSLIYPQVVNYIDVDDDYYQDQYVYYYKGFGDTLLDALDGSFCTYSAFGQKGDNNTIDPIYPDVHAGGYAGPLECGLYKPPSVISFSYGPGEPVWPINYERRQCNEWMKLALQGTTAVFASGDSGVENQLISAERDIGCLGENKTIFVAEFPPTCPYVLSVGATQIKPNVSGLSPNPEQAVNYTNGADGGYTSGGGFSNIFPRPTYQETAVSNYFKVSNNTLPYYDTTLGHDIGAHGGRYNRKGRAVPDVAANGAFWAQYTEGKLGRGGGTSMSAPIWASVINLLNEARLKAGKTTVGFLHPTLYAHPEAFHDITVGFSNGCGLDIAFECAPGWDPVTGLGTPKFEKLKEIFLSLP